jgi:arylsulfatase A
MLDFRMPTISDSGINFRRLMPEIPGFGDMEQFNLRSRGGMGHLESYYFLPKETARRMGLKEAEKPHVRQIDPEVGIWHTVKLTMKGRTFSAEYDGEVLLDGFEYHDWMINTEPAPIRLQKHIVVHGDNLGKENPCPIEYRNIFVKEIDPGAADVRTRSRTNAAANRKPPNSSHAELLARIDDNDLPDGYDPARHQDYVDRRMAKLAEGQRARIGQLWKEKERIDPDMPNRGVSFVKILAFVAGGEKSEKKAGGSKKTNVILIMADDIGYECYGAYGGTSYQTPILDKMAAEGMRFKHAYSNPVCTPTRVKIMTGLSNVRNYASFSILKKTERTIGHMMQEAGYRTAIAGKWQLYGAEHYKDLIREKGSLPQDMGFGRHCLWQVYKLGSRFWGPTITIDGRVKKFGEDVYGPDVYCEFLLDRMAEYRNEPFFLYYPMALVHSPFVPTPDSTDRNCKNKQQNFADMVAYMDKLIGRIVDKTVELGIAERTLILVTGDNGTHGSIKSNIGDRVIVGGKAKPTDGGTHVGLFAYQPRAVPAGKVSDDLIEFSDFMPTIAEATGVRPLSPTDGRSFLPQLHGEEGNPKETIFVYYWPRPEKGEPLRFVRDKRWKLYGSGKLFDVKNDVLEKSPITGSETRAIRKQLQAAMDRMPSEGQTLLKFD